MDATLNHCLATGKSLTGCLHFVNKTPVDWYSKKLATIETATYGSDSNRADHGDQADLEVLWGTHLLKIVFT